MRARLIVLGLVLGLSVLAAPMASASPATDAIKAKIAKKQAPSAVRDSTSRPGGAKSIEISIGEQVLRAYEGKRVVLSTPISTGRNGTTPTGRYRIQSKETNHWSRKYGVWMPYAMRIVGGIFVHALPVTDDGRTIGAAALGNPASHGCIRVGTSDARALFNWTPVGTPVWIH